MTHETKRNYSSPTGGSEFNLQRRIAQLDAMADERQYLERELKRADVLEELGLLGDGHLESLERRVRLFNEAVKLLTPKE